MKRLLRVWQECDLKDIEKRLIVLGELSSECFSCHKVGIGLKARTCPDCGVKFRYMGFRRKVTPAYLHKIREELPEIVLIDFEDFKRTLGKRDARNIFNI